MGWFSKKCQHNWKTFTCTLNDLGCPQFWIKQPGHMCNNDSFNACSYVLFNNIYPKNALVHFVYCIKCTEYKINITTSSITLRCKEDYIVPILRNLIKNHEDAEQNKLLALADPNYGRILDLEKENEKLKEELKLLKDKLNISIKNDAIWDSIPKADKIKLVKKYGHIKGVKLADVIP